MVIPKAVFSYYGLVARVFSAKWGREFVIDCPTPLFGWPFLLSREICSAKRIMNVLGVEFCGLGNMALSFSRLCVINDCCWDSAAL